MQKESPILGSRGQEYIENHDARAGTSVAGVIGKLTWKISDRSALSCADQLT